MMQSGHGKAESYLQQLKATDNKNILPDFEIIDKPVRELKKSEE